MISQKAITNLKVWIAENGDSKARRSICDQVNITNATLSRILQRTTFPRFGSRYRIYKLTGVKLIDDEDFNESS